MNLEGIIKNPHKVVQVFKKQPSIDGFSLKLENDSVYDVSNTQWNTDDNRQVTEGGVIFDSSEGRVFITNEQIKEIESL